MHEQALDILGSHGADSDRAESPVIALDPVKRQTVTAKRGSAENAIQCGQMPLCGLPEGERCPRRASLAHDVHEEPQRFGFRRAVVHRDAVRFAADGLPDPVGSGR